MYITLPLNSKCSRIFEPIRCMNLLSLSAGFINWLFARQIYIKAGNQLTNLLSWNWFTVHFTCDFSEDSNVIQLYKKFHHPVSTCCYICSTFIYTFQSESNKKIAESWMLCFDKSKESPVCLIILRWILVIFLTPTFISFTKLKIRWSFWGAEQV